MFSLLFAIKLYPMYSFQCFCILFGNALWSNYTKCEYLWSYTTCTDWNSQL